MGMGLSVRFHLSPDEQVHRPSESEFGQNHRHLPNLYILDNGYAEFKTVLAIKLAEAVIQGMIVLMFGKSPKDSYCTSWNLRSCPVSVSDVYDSNWQLARSIAKPTKRSTLFMWIIRCDETCWSGNMLELIYGQKFSPSM